jgi:hypothetical protein
MAWYTMQSKRASALLIAGLIAGWAMVRTAHSAAAAGDPGVVTFSRLANIPSHNGIYRASLIASRSSWTLEVRTASGTPVPGASLALESAMPDDGRVAATHPRVTELAGGQYRVDGLRLDRSGWWNVKLAISAATGSDSLAFNLVRQ